MSSPIGHIARIVGERHVPAANVQIASSFVSDLYRGRVRKSLAGERKAGVQALQKISDHVDDAGEFFFVADDERPILQR